nr:TPA_asm: hypothetical protein [Pimephales minnow adintovirus]
MFAVLSGGGISIAYTIGRGGRISNAVLSETVSRCGITVACAGDTLFFPVLSETVSRCGITAACAGDTLFFAVLSEIDQRGIGVSDV